MHDQHIQAHCPPLFPRSPAQVLSGRKARGFFILFLVPTGDLPMLSRGNENDIFRTVDHGPRIPVLFSRILLHNVVLLISRFWRGRRFVQFVKRLRRIERRPYFRLVLIEPVGCTGDPANGAAEPPQAPHNLLDRTRTLFGRRRPRLRKLGRLSGRHRARKSGAFGRRTGATRPLPAVWAPGRHARLIGIEGLAHEIAQ